MKLCVLHAGQPKTGSTSLQNYLSAHADALLRCGILYPRMGRTDGRRQHGKVMRAIAGVRKLSHKEGLPEALAAEIAGHPHEVLLISAEYLFNALFFNERPPIRAFFEARGYRIETITYLRDQPDYLNSAYVQHVKKVHEILRFEEYVQQRSEADPEISVWASTYYHRLAAPRHRYWARHTFRPYGAEVRGRGIERDFMATLRQILDRHGLAPGLTGEVVTGLPLPERANEADGPLLVAAGRRIAAGLAERYPRRKLKFLTASGYHVLADTIREMGLREERYSALTPELYSRLRETYADTNARFARKAWQCTWADRFPPRDPATLRSNDIDDTQDPGQIRLVEEAVERALPKIERLVRRAERWLEQA
ncbi:MAG TPA: hypothetical protein VFR34_00985 [Paracoccaceae bacterium]|nr:hypothetical protein [Paracoccaceae bacterium]